jgi:hypothetical protein
MLSVSKIRTTNKSAHEYYSADDYYSQTSSNNLNQSDFDQKSNEASDLNKNANDSEINIANSSNIASTPTNNSQSPLSQIPSQVPSLWQGKLATDFNLEGKVTGQISDNLEKGILPNGVNMQGKLDSNKEEIHDSGRDLTFSAPKSVSILSEVLEIDSLKKLHDLAVTKTLDHIEENYSFTRIKSGGKSGSSSDSKITKQLTKNLLFATYTHNTSRELDPQLHTHSIIYNEAVVNLNF